MSEHDTIIRGGTVVDGTGAPARTADVAIDNGVITEVGEVSGSADRTIDADGLLVTPGFVDIHAHYDGQASWGERMIPSSWHGVTTVVVGNCGVGFAPVHPGDHDRLIELMEGVEDIPGAVLHEGLAWNWQSFPEFMDSLDGRPFDVDVAVQVPHGALRLHVMGERGAKREVATADDIDAMARIAREGIEAGALGFTTSRTLNHRTSKGEFTPTLTAEADELVGIARAIGETGKGVLQGVSDFADVDAEFAIFRRMAEESGRPVSFSLVQVRGDTYRRQLELLASANADGVPMTGQVAPRPVGLMLGLECTLHPLLGNPVYREISALPLAERVAIMADPHFKARVLAADAAQNERSEAREPGDPGVRSDVRARRSARLRARRRATASRRAPQREGRDALDLAYDLLLQDGGRSFLYLPFLNYADGNLDAVGEMLAHPNTVVGLGDGGAHLGTICDASFPTTLADAVGARPRSRPARPPVRGAAPHECDGAHGRSPRSRCARAGLPRRRERDRLRAPHRAPAGDAPRPARGRQAARAVGRGLRRDDRRGRGHLRERRGEWARCPVASFAARKAAPNGAAR